MSDSDSCYSDEESPVAVSFQKSKDEVKNFEKDVTTFLKEQREAVKEKRRKKNETLKAQSSKKPKRAKEDTSVEPQMPNVQDAELESKMLPANVLAAISEPPIDKNDAEDRGSDDELADEPDSDTVLDSKRKIVTGIGKKEYKGLNIHVESLLHVTRQRVDNALAFRNKRFSKGHRESVKVNLVHQKKLAASGQDLPKPKHYL